MARTLKSYCIGHVPPMFTPPIEYSMLCPKPLGTAHELVIDDNRFGPDIDGGSLAEYSQLFALSEMIQSGDVVADDLFLFQYRKFLSPNEGGLESRAPWVRVLRAPDAAGMFPSEQQLHDVQGRIIVGSLFDLGASISGNYAMVHVIEDLVMFSAACAKCTDLSQADLRSLATLRGIIPSPALCYTRADAFVKVMNILSQVWTEFSTHYHVKRDGYQRRVAGYLLERLHSVLLCKWLMDGSEPTINVWQRYVVTNE